jgi:hypothetical protein
MSHNVVETITLITCSYLVGPLCEGSWAHSGGCDRGGVGPLMGVADLPSLNESVGQPLQYEGGLPLMRHRH